MNSSYDHFLRRLGKDRYSLRMIRDFVKEGNVSLLNWIFRGIPGIGIPTNAKMEVMFSRVMEAIFAFDDWELFDFLVDGGWICSIHSSSKGELQLISGAGIKVCVFLPEFLLRNKSFLVHGYLTQKLGLYIYLEGFGKRKLEKYGKFIAKSAEEWRKIN